MTEAPRFVLLIKQISSLRSISDAKSLEHPVPVPGKKVRVVGTNGSLTGYAGGIDKKIALLELEHTNMSDFFVPKKGTTL